MQSCPLFIPLIIFYCRKMCCSLENTTHVSSWLLICFNIYHCVWEELELRGLVLLLLVFGLELFVFSDIFCCNKSWRLHQRIVLVQYIPASGVPLEKVYWVVESISTTYLCITFSPQWQNSCFLWATLNFFAIHFCFLSKMLMKLAAGCQKMWHYQKHFWVSHVVRYDISTVEQFTQIQVSSSP